MRRLPRVASKGPLALAGLLSVPLYFSTLLASSLALDKPHIVGVHEHEPTNAMEAKIWLAALLVPALLLGTSLAALPLRRFGIYLVAVIGVAVCFALPPVSQGWVARHTRRFPLGMDFVKDSSVSNLSSRGEWEHSAQATIVSITHWTLVVAVGALVIGALLELRRRHGIEQGPAAPPGIHAPDATTPSLGDPTV